MQVQKTPMWKVAAGAALCMMCGGTTMAQDDPVIVKDDGTIRVPDIPATKPNATPKHSPNTNMMNKPPAGSDERADMMLQNARMLKQAKTAESLRNTERLFGSPLPVPEAAVRLG